MTNIPENKTRNIKNLDSDIYHQARIAAVTAKLTIGAWVTQAIKERLNKEKGE